MENPCSASTRKGKNFTMQIPGPVSLNPAGTSGILAVQKSLCDALFALLVYAKRTLFFLLAPRRFLFLIPPLFRLQVLYDRARGRLIRCRIRDFVDFSVLEQIYWTQDYDLRRLARWPEIQKLYNETRKLGKTPWILDCGGNIGLASRYFSETYEQADILCVEPHPANLALARINNPSPRVRFLEAAVGREKGLASILDPGQGGNAFQIAASPAGQVAVMGIRDLLAQHTLAHYAPFLIKIDIEGSEERLFSGDPDWIDQFPVLIIELHDWMLPRRGTSKPFLQALASRDRDFLYFGENIYSLSNRLL
jgi:FkbM family methyltransferase